MTEQEIKFRTDIDRVRRNGNMAIACTVLCFFTGCCNYCANCCMVPFLMMFGQKAVSLRENVDEKQCCCLCSSQKSLENVKTWSLVYAMYTFVWTIALIFCCFYASWIMAYPEYECRYESRYNLPELYSCTPYLLLRYIVLRSIGSQGLGLIVSTCADTFHQ